MKIIADKIKGIVVEIGAETKGLNVALKDVNSQSRSLQGELKQVERLLKFSPDNAELLAQKQKLLTDQVGNTETKLKALKSAQDQVKEAFERGDIGEEKYRSFQREIIKTESQLGNLKEKLDSLDDSKGPEKAEQEIKAIDRAAQRAKDSLAAMGTGLGNASRSIAGAAAAGAGAIGGLVMGTQELNTDLAKLRFNAFNEGFDTKNVEEGFKRIAAISGETDSAVETVSNLMATGFDDQQLSTAIDLVNGAAIKFSDTLKTEGIADGIQETFATGEAVGPFAELLERSGVDLENFNAGLAEAAKTGQETDYVLQTMTDLGLAGATDAFSDMNSELMNQRQAQLDLQMVLADLGIALTPLATMVTEFLTKLGEWGLENINLVKSFDSISEGIVALLPNLFGSGLKMITTIIQAIVDNLPMILESGTLILTTLLNGIIEMLPDLISQIQQLIPVIQSTLQENLPMIISAGIQILLMLLDGIVQMLPQLIDLAIDLIVLIAKELLNNLPKIIDAGIKIIFGLIDGLVNAIPDINSAIIEDILPAISDSIGSLDLFDIGVDIIKGLIKGIVSMGTELGKAAWNLAKKIGSNVSEALQTGSPSKLMIKEGLNTGDGLVIGLEKSVGNVGQAANDLVNAVIKNDRLVDLPNNFRWKVSEFGKILAPNIEKSPMIAEQTRIDQPKSLTVTLNSPKALDVREANTIFNRTLNRMSLMW